MPSREHDAMTRRARLLDLGFADALTPTRDEKAFLLHIVSLGVDYTVTL